MQKLALLKDPGRAFFLAQLSSEEVAAFGEDNRNFDVMAQYADAVRALAREECAVFVDVWAALWEAAGKDLEGLRPFMSDGPHLTPEGYSVSGYT